MTANWKLFSRLVLRPLEREPIRTLLTVFAVGLGVGVVIAINLAGQSAAGSFQSSLESLTGKGDFMITATGGLDERVLGKLVRLPYAFEFIPRVEDFAFLNGKGEALPFIGLDLIGHGKGEGRDVRATTANFSAGAPIWVGKDLGLHAGDHVPLLINDTMHPFAVADVLPERQGENNVVVADIGVAQEVTRKQGKLDSIDVRMPPGESPDYWREKLERELPASLSVEPQGSRTDENRKMLAAFRWNLHVLSYIALIVGGFLIYNTISISVVRRRNAIGIVRALGATRAAVSTAFFGEALLFGVTGSALGILIGRMMAGGAVSLIGSTVESLYVSSSPAQITLTPVSVATGVLMGLCISVLAALAPAIEAAHIPPVEAMARGREQYQVAVRSRKTIFAALGMLVGAAVFSQLPPVHRQPVFAYLAVLLLIAGTAGVIPNVVTLFARVASQKIQKIAGVEGLLAMRSLRASLGRTSVLTGALATAVAMTASVGIMVGSFRQTVAVWMNDQLKADLYLRPAGVSAADRHPTLSADIAARIERLDGVAAVDRFRAYPISYDGLPATLAGGETSKAETAASTRFLGGENRQQLLAKLPSGDYAVVSEPFANKHGVHVGSMVQIPLGGAMRRFEVVGIYYDYSTERGFIVLDRHTLLKYLPDPAASNLAVYVKPGADIDGVRRKIDGIISGRAVAVFSNGALRRGAIEVFDRTFRITYALEGVAIAVAVMGIAGALLAMVIDRRREFALLRFLGGAQPQIRRIILSEAGLLGLLANAIGLVLGGFLSLILIFVINKQSFGWTLQLHWPVGLLLTALTGVYIATVVAGLYPARTATSMNPIEVIHEE